MVDDADEDADELNRFGGRRSNLMFSRVIYLSDLFLWAKAYTSMLGHRSIVWLPIIYGIFCARA